MKEDEPFRPFCVTATAFFHCLGLGERMLTACRIETVSSFAFRIMHEFMHLCSVIESDGRDATMTVALISCSTFKQPPPCRLLGLWFTPCREWNGCPLKCSKAKSIYVTRFLHVDSTGVQHQITASPLTAGCSYELPFSARRGSLASRCSMCIPMAVESLGQNATRTLLNPG